MTDWLYPTAFSSWLHPTGPDLSSPEFAAYDRVLRSGRLTMGPETEAFEAELAAYHGRRHAVAVNSGSSANLVAVAALAVHYGWELDVYPHAEKSASVPSVAWATTYAPLVQHRVEPSDVRDTDSTWNSPLPPLRKLGIPRWAWSDLYVVCSILGNPIDDAEKIPTLKAEHPSDCPVLEDNCESLGARTADGRLTGTFGDLSTGSGFHSHQLSAIELGWVLTDDYDLARLCRMLRNHGNAGWQSDDFEQKYYFACFGYNVRPLEAHCAVAREQLKKLDQMNGQRRLNLQHFYDEAPAQIIHQKMVGNPAPFGLAFEVESRERRRALAEALRAEGVDCRLPTGGSFTRHPYGRPWRDQPTPRADRIHDCGLFLGNAPFPIPDKIEAAARVMRSVL